MVWYGKSNACAFPEGSGHSSVCKLPGLLRCICHHTAERHHEVLFHHRSNPDGTGKSHFHQKETEREELKLGGRPWPAGAVIGMYLLSLYLVIGQKLNIKPIFGMVGIAFILVVLFGGMAPDKTIGQGLKAGLGDAFTVFLNTISCFGNVMSYIRLFAVGMAGFAISQSFNGIAAGFHGPLIILGVVVVLIGHGLNIIMCFLSVVVHGVRLNVLEFSGQAGLEWTGIAYEPFKVNEKIKK